MKILITDHAKSAMDDIVAYYSDLGYGKYGRKLRASVLRKALKLRRFPKMGAIEALLAELGLEHRYIVEGNFKIIYRIAEETIYITDIFDTRRSPEDINP
jgi:plasmid stabilization system protein ParE